MSNVNASINILGLHALVNGDAVDKAINISTVETNMLSLPTFPDESEVRVDRRRSSEEHESEEMSATPRAPLEAALQTQQRMSAAGGSPRSKAKQPPRRIVNSSEEDENRLIEDVGVRPYRSMNSRSDVRHAPVSMPPLQPTYSQPPPQQQQPNPYQYQQPQPQQQQQPHNEYASQTNQAAMRYGIQNVDTFTLDVENQEDMKALLLEDIAELCVELKAAGKDISYIAPADSNMSIRELERIRKSLTIRYDRQRYEGFGTEMILAVADGLEYIFNGERSILGHKFDLTGWRTTVRTKIRRMRYETSTIVSRAFARWNIGPVTSIMLELVPSAFLYSKDRNEQKLSARITQDQYSSALNDLRDEFET